MAVQVVRGAASRLIVFLTRVDAWRSRVYHGGKQA